MTDLEKGIRVLDDDTKELILDELLKKIDLYKGTKKEKGIKILIGVLS